MKRNLFFILFFLPAFLINAQTMKIMLVTGGHQFDTLEFFDMFDAMDKVEYDHFEQPKANAELLKNKAEGYDVLVFYDMWKTISEPERSAYIELTKQGKPFLFLHHSIVSYQDWPEFEKIIGGKYFEKNKNVPKELHSSYEHDVWVYSKVDNYTPVTKGFTDLRFFDEVYGNVRISDQVVPLLKTRHPQSMETVAWENRYNDSKIIYIQSGHDKRTFVEPDYRKLLLQAIQYLAASN